jgi:hypothetical protein
MASGAKPGRLPSYITYSRSGSSPADPSGGACVARTAPQRWIAVTKPAAMRPSRMWPIKTSIAACHSALLTFCAIPSVRDHPRIVLRHRYEDENSASIARVRHVADDELFERGSVRPGTPYGARHERKAKRHPRENEARHDEAHELQQENSLHAPLREIDQWPWEEERQQSRPKDRDICVARG